MTGPYRRFKKEMYKANLYKHLFIKNPGPTSRAGRILHNLSHFTNPVGTKEACGGWYDMKNGNDHNALIGLKNGGFINGKKVRNRWRWSITEKGRAWEEEYPISLIVEKL